MEERPKERITALLEVGRPENKKISCHCLAVFICLSVLAPWLFLLFFTVLFHQSFPIFVLITIYIVYTNRRLAVISNNF